MKKLALLMTAFCVCALAWVCYSQDPIFEKTEPSALVADLRRNSKDPEALVDLIRQSIESKQVEMAYQTLDEMRREQPDSAVVLAAYAMAHDAAWYQIRKSSGAIRERTKQEDRDYEVALKRAKQLDPNLWLTYVVEGFPLAYNFTPRFDEGLDLLHKAVQLAPESAFARYQYAKVLDLAAANKKKWNDKTVAFEEAADEIETAHKLDPQSSDIAYLLFAVYDLNLKDAEKATRAKRAFLKTLPPGYNLSKFVRGRLARYPD